MSRFKLEMYVDILKVLVHNGPLNLKHIMNKANIKGNILREYLDFLINKGFVEERIIEKRSVAFAVTERGISVLKYFRELTQGLAVVEEP
jgi:predicted transcriptional regulator